MKRKVEYIFAGYGGKPVYVQGYLAKGPDTAGRVKLQVVSTNPEPRPAPGFYEAADLPGGWIRLLPDPDGADDAAVMAAATAAGFMFTPAA